MQISTISFGTPYGTVDYQGATIPVPLSQLGSLPVGTTVDATAGVARITSAAGGRAVQTGDFVSIDLSFLLVRYDLPYEALSILYAAGPLITRPPFPKPLELPAEPSPASVRSALLTPAAPTPARRRTRRAR